MQPVSFKSQAAGLQKNSSCHMASYRGSISYWPHLLQSKKPSVRFHDFRSSTKPTGLPQFHTRNSTSLAAYLSLQIALPGMEPALGKRKRAARRSHCAKKNTGNSICP